MASKRYSKNHMNINGMRVWFRIHTWNFSKFCNSCGYIYATPKQSCRVSKLCMLFVLFKYDLIPKALLKSKKQKTKNKFRETKGEGQILNSVSRWIESRIKMWLKTSLHSVETIYLVAILVHLLKEIVVVILKSIYFNWRYMNCNLKVQLNANFWIL